MIFATEKISTQLKKASTDNKNYKLNKVAEEINLLQVTDAESQYFAIAFLLKTGSFNDPDDCPGLAHLFEHCLFTGSKHFSKDNQLTHYLDQHHGQVNAWTSPEQTVFYMKVHQAAADKALEMLLDMLLNPLFSLEGIVKESQAIDAEFNNKRTEEQRRIQEVIKETCNPLHPFSGFSVGNKATFEPFTTQELQQKLRQWHSTWLTSSNLQICTFSGVDSTATQDRLCAALAAIPAQPKTPDTDALPPLYTETELQKIIFIRSHKQHLRLMLTFPLQQQHLHLQEKYDALVSHLMGYEGAGSLLHFLKQQKWATQLISGPGLTGSNFTDFNVNIELTETGLENMESVIQSVILFKNMLLSSDLKRHFEEKAKLNELAFCYHTPEAPLDCVLRLVRNMCAYPEDEVLRGEYLMSNFHPQTLLAMLADIRPTNMRVMVIAPNAPANRESFWYKVPYSIHNIAFDEPEQWLKQRFAAQVSLPSQNRYIAQPRQKLDKVSQRPKCHKIKGQQFWIGRDNINSDAQGECFFSWRANYITPDIQHVANKKLFTSTMEARLNDHFYSALVAGLHYRVYAHQHGLGLHTSGFADKQLPLCQEIIQQLTDVPTLCDNFDLHKQEYLNTLQSTVSNKPLNRLFTVLQAVFVQASWLPEDLAQQVKSSEFGDVMATQQQLFGQYQCEALLYGDFQQDEMQKFIQQCPYSQTNGSETHASSLVLLHDIQQRSLNFPCRHHDAAYVFYLQSKQKTLEDQAKMMLVESLLAGFYFNWMRNEKQLGYQVGTGYMPFNEHPGTTLYVQSTASSAVQIDLETRQCLQHFCQWLKALSPSEWDRSRQNIIRQLNQENVSFSVTCQRLWAAIGRGDTNFQTEQHIQQIIMSLPLQQVVNWFSELLFELNNHFTIYSPGSIPSDTSHFAQPLTEIYQFKHSC